MILFLEDNDDLRLLMCDLIAYRWQIPCMAFADVDSLIAAGDRALRAGLAMLDINLGNGKKSGLDALAWLRDRDFRGRICFLTGHGRSHPLVASAAASDVEVLAKPIAVADLDRVVTSAFPELRRGL